MLKIAGGIIVLVAAAFYGWRLSMEQQEHLEQLLAMKEMFLMLEGEISYTKTPLREAFVRIATQNKEPFAGFLKKAAEGLLENRKSMGDYWRSLVEQEENRFLFSKEERELLKRSGENFGYLDGQMQLKNLELYIGQAEVMIEQFQKELKEKQKLAQTLSVMCGLFVIILLL